MKEKELALSVKGMTCTSCEARIEKALAGLTGVLSSKADYSAGLVRINYDSEVLGEDLLRAAVEEAGYPVLRGRARPAFLPLGLAFLLIAAYFAVDAAGGFNLLPDIDSSFGYGMLVLAGILTSFHCIAMCGGIALSQSLPDAPEEPRESLASRLRPGLLYNSGRLLSYTLLGGAIGAAGSVLDFSPAAKAVITAAAGFFMLLLALRMLGFLRFLSRLRLPRPRLPRSLAGLSAKLRGRGPFTVGLLNGLMPCGPLQTMQLYALGTGSALAGGLALFLFGLGTFPLLLAFGIAAASLPKRHAFTLARAGAVLILFFGLLTLGRAYTLTGSARPALLSSGGKEASGPAKAVLQGNVQVVTTEMGASRYVPFTVQKGVPVRWTIRVKEENLNGCNNALVVPAFGLKVRLKPGDTVVEFTPDKEGAVPYSCWMGMIRSRITVVSDLSEAAEPAAGAKAAAGVSASPRSVGRPVLRNGIQEVTVAVKAGAYEPSVVVLERGKKAKFVFKPEALDPSNSIVVFPEYRGRLELRSGELETPVLDITEDFTFRSWLGTLNGYVKVVDDPSRADPAAVLKEIELAGLEESSQSCCSTTP